VKFLVDAHLPRALCAILTARGHDAVHTSDLPTGNTTPDEQINDISVAEDRIVISKDTDFFYSHVLRRRPWKLLLLRTGNMGASELCGLLAGYWSQIETGLDTHTLLEVDRQSVTTVVRLEP